MSRRDDGPVEFDVSIGAFPSWAADALAAGAWEGTPPPDEMQIEGEEGEDPVLAFRRTLGMFATGVTVVTTTSADQVHGMTANAFMSVSLRPPLVLISVDGRAKMHALLNEGKRIGISVLSEHQEALSDRFAGKPGGTGPEPSFDVVRETPLVEGALAHLVARVTRSYWGGDHSLFLGQVEFARYGEGLPLLFHGGRYERLVEDPERRGDPAHDDRGRPLNVVVEARDAVAVTVEQADRVVLLEVLPLEHRVGGNTSITDSTKASTKSSYGRPRSRGSRHPRYSGSSRRSTLSVPTSSEMGRVTAG